MSEMPQRLSLQGNRACALGAIAAGCRLFAGYPITPSSEVAETMAKELPRVDGVFIQMEDDIDRIQPSDRYEQKTEGGEHDENVAAIDHATRDTVTGRIEGILPTQTHHHFKIQNLMRLFCGFQ